MSDEWSVQFSSVAQSCPSDEWWGVLTDFFISRLSWDQCVGGVCNFLGSVSPQQKFEVTDFSVTACVNSVIALGQTSVIQPHVTAQFHLESKGRCILEVWGHGDPKGAKRREAPGPLLTPPFMYSSPPLGLPCVNWASQENCLFYLRSSLWSSDLPLTFVCSIFMGFSLPCLLATTILDSCFLF